MEFNVNPYYDDFEATNGPRDNNYMRILFKPGYAVQARELTQIQSIIQNQIKQFGNHIFKDGSPVSGGHLSLDTTIKSLKLQAQYDLQDIDLTSFLGNMIINDSGAEVKRAQVLAIDDTQTYPTILIRYITGPEFSDNEVISVADDTTIKAQLIDTSAQSSGSAVSINEGVFYVDGFFVKVSPQTIPLDPYSTTPTFRVGLSISEAIVNYSEDSMLLDPAQGSFNYQAPGADRFQFDLVLEHRTIDSTDDSKFFELLRVENGEITRQVDYPIYSDISREFAKRTYDESGNYTVKAWRASPIANTANTEVFDLDIEGGKGYIKGYEFETKGTTILTLDKARTISTSNDYELSLEYGNYVVTKNLYGGQTSGSFDTSTLASVDLHCIDSANINTSSATTYSNTKIGTARIRNLTNAGNGKYYSYLFDINTSPIVATVAAASTNGNSIRLPTNFSDKSNAYANVYVRVISGTGEGDVRKIVTYDGASKTAFVDRNFSVANLGVTSRVSLNFSTDDLESIVTTPSSYAANVYGTKDSTQALFACMDIDVLSKVNKDPKRETYIAGTDFNNLVFKFPQSYIANSNFSSISMYRRRKETLSFDSSGNASLTGSSKFETGEEIYYGSDGNDLSSIQADTNFLVVVKTISGSNAAVGQVVDFTRSSPITSITRASPTSLTLKTGYTGGTFTADVYYNVKVNSPQRRDKILYGNNSLTTLQTSGSIAFTPSTGTSVTGAANVKVDTANAIIWYTSASENSKTPGIKQSLYLPDVLRIIKVYDSGSPLYAPNVSNAIDITNNYLFNPGQSENYYDHSSIILKDTASPPSGQTAIMVQYFNHTSLDGYFSADSYDYTSVYSQDLIPLFVSKKSTFSLRDALDFRPTRPKLTTATAMGNLYMPLPELSMVLTYGFYLPRIDKLIVTENKEFKLLTGTPASSPQEPSVSDEGAMTLYSIYVPAFTSDIKDIKLRYFENKRYTMRDIGTLEKRIEQVEYYTTLSLLENAARSEKVLYQESSLQKEKYGIVVDQFDGFNICDNKNADLVCQLSYNQLKPYKITKEVPLKFVSASGSYTVHDKTYSLSFTEVPVVTQSSATKSISVQPYLFGTFQGSVVLSPETDYWMSTKLTPVIVSPPEDRVTPATPPVVSPSVPVTGPQTMQITLTALASGSSLEQINQNIWVTGVNTTSLVLEVPSDFVGFGFVNWQDWLRANPAVTSSAQSLSGSSGVPLEDIRAGVATFSAPTNIWLPNIPAWQARG